MLLMGLVLAHGDKCCHRGHSRFALIANIYDCAFPLHQMRTGPEVIKLLSCSTQLSMKFFQLTNVKMPTILGILTFMSRKNSIIGLFESEKKLNFLIFFILMSI